MKIRLFILVFVTFLESYSTLRNPIYDIVSRVDSKWCYKCEENCANSALDQCVSAKKCFSKVTRTDDNKHLETKGCVQENSTKSICGGDDETTISCYTCEGDYCNADSNNDDEDLGVTKCYVCIDECSEPIVYHDCREVLTEKEGKPVKAACLSYEINQEGNVTTSKGCIPDNEVIRNSCSYSNAVYNEITCSICDTDLCNHKQEQEDGVEQCYYCEDVCEAPLQTHNCNEVLEEGASARCISINATYGGQIIIYRGCVDYTSQTQILCELANLQGGSCEICNTDFCNGIKDDNEENNNDGSSSETLTSMTHITFLIILTLTIV